MNMLKGECVLRLLAAVVLLGIAPAGCNNDDDPNTSDLDGYFESHPYVSDPRGRGEGIMSITPDSALVNTIGGRAVFSVSGGNEPYNWDVANPAVGTVRKTDETDAVYTALAVGVNDVIVYDRDGNAAIAHIGNSAVSEISIKASSEVLTNNGALAVLEVEGGSPPFTWTVVDETKGVFSGGSVGSSVVYKRLVAGDNAVTVKDGGGNQASLLISQP